MAGGWRAVQIHRQEQLEVKGNDVGCQAYKRQQGCIHAAQPDQSLVLHHLDHHLHRTKRLLLVLYLTQVQPDSKGAYMLPSQIKAWFSTTWITTCTEPSVCC